MAKREKYVVRISFSIWVACWLFIFLVLPFEGKKLPEGTNVAVFLLLGVSSWVFFLTAAKAKGYSYIIGIGLMILNILGAVILAFLPDKSVQPKVAAEGAITSKGQARKLLTAYIAIGVFLLFCTIYAGEARPDPYYVPYPAFPSLLAALIAAAIAWTIHWPSMLSGDPFPPMREGFRRMAFLVLVIGSLLWWAYVVSGIEWSKSIRPASVLLFFAGPLLLMLAISIATRVIAWVHTGFQIDGKG